MSYGLKAFFAINRHAHPRKNVQAYLWSLLKDLSANQLPRPRVGNTTPETEAVRANWAQWHE